MKKGRWSLVFGRWPLGAVCSLSLAVGRWSLVVGKTFGPRLSRIVKMLLYRRHRRNPIRLGIANDQRPTTWDEGPTTSHRLSHPSSSAISALPPSDPRRLRGA